MTKLLTTVAGMALITLTGCATMTAEQCVAADWRTIGYQDAMEGRTASHLEHHIDACSDYGIAADEAAYATGHANGARAFCTPANGFRLGRSGGTNNNICPADLANAFSVTYEAGRGLYTRSQAVRSAETSLDSLERQMQQLEQTIAHNENVIATLNLSPADRAQLQTRVSADREKHRRLSKQRKRAQEKIDSAERDYNTYRDRIEDQFFSGL